MTTDKTDALTTVNGHGALRVLEYTERQLEMIRDQYANGATEEEFQVLIMQAKARNLNVLLRQVHFVQRWDSNKKRMVWSLQVSIDGLRAVAQRTGFYDGQDEPEFVYDNDGRLTCAKVKVYRKDWKRPAVGIAHYSEYAQFKKDGGVTMMWETKPHIMLAKCAEALGIRKAFPEDTGGLYTNEEMGQSQDEDLPALPLPKVIPIKTVEPEPQFQSRVIRAETVTDSDDEPFVGPNDAKAIRDWTKKITETTTPQEKLAVGKAIKEANLTFEAKAVLTKIYRQHDPSAPTKSGAADQVKEGE